MEQGTAPWGAALETLRVGGRAYRFDVSASPEATEQLAAAIVEALRPYGVDVVVHPEGIHDDVLAHLVARGLGTARAGVTSDLGRLEAEEDRVTGRRAAIVALEWPDGLGAAVLRGYVTSVGGTPVVTLECAAGTVEEVAA